jgi:hypothetical protein
MIKAYRQDLKRLQTTGEGISSTSGDVEGEESDKEGVQDSSEHQFLDHYVPATGPDEKTPEAAKNLWGAFLLIICQFRTDKLQALIKEIETLNKANLAVQSIVPLPSVVRIAVQTRTLVEDHNSPVIHHPPLPPESS